jgi:hypothetical protein
VVAVVPSLLAVLAMGTAGWLDTLVGVLAALTGPLAWGVLAGPLAKRGRRRA